MVNCNPETVSTDYDTADRLYFEPLTFEDVLEVVHAEQASGTVAGRDRAARRADPARARAAAHRRRACRSSAPSPAAIDLAEDRGAFGEVLRRGRACPRRRSAPRRRSSEAREIADRIGYPVLVRPSYVLGGRGMEIVYDERDARRLHRPGHRRSARSARCWSTGSSTTPSRSTSTRCATAREVFLGGVMEHIEEAGVHSGDSSCALPPITLGPRDARPRCAAPPRRSRTASACAGCSTCSTRCTATMLYVLEANPRASRTVPFVSKATAVPLAKAAARIMLGATHRRAARRGAAAGRRATAASCRRTRRSR